MHQICQQACVENKLHHDTHLRQTEHGAEYPCDADHDLHFVRSTILADGVQDRNAAIDADNDDDVRGLVQPEHLHIDPSD